MRIMQIITLSDLGGAQSVLVQLANTLCNDNEVIVVAGNDDGKMWGNLDNRIQMIKCPYLHRRISLINDLLTFLFLIRLRLKYHPDIVHLHSSKIGVLGRLTFPRSRTVYTVHGFDSIRVVYRNSLPGERILQHLCRAIVAVSDYDLRNLRAEGITHHLYKVYNGISINQQPNITPPPIPGHFEGKVLCIARISKQKRYDLFIETAKLLPQYAFIWIGNLQEMKDTPPNVFLLGNISQASCYCQYADLFFLPSNYEGLPIVIIEAMSYGKPIVASRVGGVSEIVREGVNGYTVDNDPKCFAGKISLLLHNPQLAKSLGDNSLKIYHEELTANHMVSEYVKIYQKIVHAPH